MRTRGRAQEVRTTAIRPPVTLLQRKCACGGTLGVDGECAACRAKRLARERGAGHGAANALAPPMVHDVLRSSGQPLDPATRAFMEPRFGHDFSQVRVHTDGRAGESARAVDALAYTVGPHLVFAEGQHQPDTNKGRRLLAHELTHVVQQGHGALGPALAISAPGDAAEREAEGVASAITHTPRGQAPVAIARRGPARLQRLGANPGCTAAETTTIHQAIFNARGWLNKAMPQMSASPLSAAVTASLRRNFGPTYGVAANAPLILARLHAAFHELSTIPIGCAGAADATCATNPCGYTPVAGGHAATICSNVTLTAGTSAVFQAGCVLHESLHASFSRFTVDEYSGWHGASSSSATYPGTGTDPLLNADSYTTLVMDLS